MSTGIVFGRAYNCSYCQQFYNMGEERLIDYAIAAGITYWEPARGAAVWPTIQATLANGNCFVHMAHSNATVMGGDNVGTGYMIAELNATSITALNSKAVYSFSCRPAQSILPAILADGALAVAGFNDDYWFYIESSYLDDYFQSTMAPGFEFARSIIDDRTWAECYTDTIAKFNTEIARWTSGDLSSKPYASSMAAILLEDRAALWSDGDDTWHLLGGAAVGTITVTANIAGASYTITGPATYVGSGTSFSQANAPAGDYTISYGAVVGYTTPANETLTLAEGATIAFTGTYVAEATTGTIYVSTNIPGATFALTGPASYSGSGVTWSQAGALTGKYTIAYGDVSGYATPSAESLTLVSGGSIAFIGEYSTTVRPGLEGVATRKTQRANDYARDYPYLKSYFMEFPCDNYYPTGGYDFDLTKECPFKVHVIISAPYGGYTCEADQSTNKLLVLKGGAEVANGTDLSDVFFMLECRHFIGFTGRELAPTIQAQQSPGAVTTIFTVSPTTVIDAGETVIDVTGLNEISLKNAEPTTVTEFTGMVAGQYLGVNFNDDGYSILQHNDAIRLRDRYDFQGYIGARVWLYFDGNYFREVN